MTPDYVNRLAPAIKRPWHEAIIDMWIADPTLKQGDIARALGKTQAWLSIVVNSDAFRMKFAERKAEFVDPILAATVEDRLRAVANGAAEEFLRRLEVAPQSVSNKDLLGAMRVSGQGLGLGAPNQPTVAANLYFVSAPQPAASRAQWQEAVDASIVRERAAA